MISQRSGEFSVTTCVGVTHRCRRALADVENRGKLNLAEFHVAMGLIYRSMCLYLTSTTRR